MQDATRIFAKDFWSTLSTFEQLTYIGHSVDLAIDWRKKGESLQVNDEIEKALHLLDLTIADPKNVIRSREIIIVKELLIDDFRGSNEYKSTDEAWHKYFAFFEHLVKNRKEDNL